MCSKFDLYEKVIASSSNPSLQQINGKTGAVLGKACADDGRWSYGVFMYDDSYVWSVWEDELVVTGEFDRSENFETGKSIRVSIRGEILD